MSAVLEARRFLRGLFDAGLEAALPRAVLAAHLPSPPSGRVLVLGAGKAAASMAQVVERVWPEARISGLVVTRYGHGVATEHIEVVEADHPVPDRAGRDAAARMLALARAAGPEDFVLCLISGGASALLSLPAEGVALAEKQAVNAALLKCGAPIDDMNALRKRLSAIKGGRLAAAIAPAPSLTLLISDVPGDDPAVIGSGPTVADARGPEAALRVVERYGLHLDEGLLEVIRNNDSIAELPRNQRVEVIATPQMALEAAARRAREQGVQAIILGDAIEGEAREVAQVMAGEVARVRRDAHPGAPPCVLLSGGETTVTLHGDGGRGGRNTEFLLALGLALDGMPGVHAIACDTDGIDGSEDNAGACLADDSLARAAAAGIDARALLDGNDAYGFFEALDDLIVTGPTLTNVNDFRAIYITD